MQTTEQGTCHIKEPMPKNNITDLWSNIPKQEGMNTYWYWLSPKGMYTTILHPNQRFIE
jgi:hypothetical protein